MYNSITDSIELHRILEDTNDNTKETDGEIGIENVVFDLDDVVEQDDSKNKSTQTSNAANCMHLLFLSERNTISRLPYHQIENSVFFCHNPNGDETDQPSFSKADDDAEGPIDAFIIIYQSGLARKTSWEAQVDEVVYNETDEFWQQVYS